MQLFSRSHDTFSYRLDARACLPLVILLHVALVFAQAPAAPLHPPAQTTPPVPASAPAQSTTPPAKPAPPRFVIVLDAAHGGDDNGAQLGPSEPEKNITLALSVRLRSLLAARGFGVVTTRESNSNVETDQRAQIANHATATACLSLHASSTGAGVHLFVSSLPPTGPSRFMAWKTAQSAYVTRSLKLASTINSALAHSSSAGSEGDSGTVALAIPVTLAQTALPGVDSMTCPAVAIELAPLRSADHSVATGVSDQQYQAQVATALAAALLEWRTDIQGDSHPGGRQP